MTITESVLIWIIGRNIKSEMRMSHYLILINNEISIQILPLSGRQKSALHIYIFVIIYIWQG